MFTCLSAGKYIQITMKGWKYDIFRTRVKSDQCNNGGGGGIVVQKWREEGVSVNTFYFTILFRNCCESGVNLLWDCIESVQKM